MSKKNRHSANRKYVCDKHPERIAAASHGIKGLVCYECLWGKDLFKHRFGDVAETFYKPGGAGYAGA